MKMTPVTTSLASDVTQLVDAGDAQVMAMALAVQDARQSREQARANRDAAYQDRIDSLHHAADKLRQIASNTLYSGLLQAGIGVVSAALSASADLLKTDATSVTSAQMAAQRQGAAGLLRAFGSADSFQSQNAHLEAARRQDDIHAEVAQRAVDRESDTMAEAQRNERAVIEQMRQLFDARQRGLSAVASG